MEQIVLFRMACKVVRKISSLLREEELPAKVNLLFWLSTWLTQKLAKIELEKGCFRIDQIILFDTEYNVIQKLSEKFRVRVC